LRACFRPFPAQAQNQDLAKQLSKPIASLDLQSTDVI